MEYLKFIQNYLMENTKGGFVLLAMLVGFNIYQIEQINVSLSPVVERATTEYPYEVLSIALRPQEKEGEIVEEVSHWVNIKDDEKIAAMRTLCRVSPDRLSGLMTPSTITKTCRIVS